jgi:recombination protein RecA
MHAAALRAKIESAIEDRFPSPFKYYADTLLETVPTLISELDAVTGGIPRGGLTEICGPESSGRTGLLISMLASIASQGELCALVDGSDAFDPHSLARAGMDSKRLLWVRCRNIHQALRAADLVLQGGGFGMLALDLAGLQARIVRQIPLSTWFRLRRAVEHTRTVLVVVEHEPSAKSCSSLTLQMKPEITRWLRTGTDDALDIAPCFRPASAAPSLRSEPALSAAKGQDLKGGATRCRPSHSVLLGGIQLNTQVTRFRNFAPTQISLTTRAAW